MGSPKTVKIEFDDIHRETYKAWCIVIAGKQYWLAKSQVVLSEDKRTVFMAEWLGKEKGLI